MKHKTENQPKEFYYYINTNSDHVNITMEYVEHKMNFLDIFVSRESSKLGSNLYHKKHRQKRGVCAYPSWVASAVLM